MVFGIKRRMVTKQVTDGMAPYVRALEMRMGSVPTEMLNDNYVLGYLNMNIVLLAKISSQGSIKGQDLGLLIMDVFKNLFGDIGRNVSSKTLVLMQSGNPDFQRGARNAEKVVATAFKWDEYDEDPDVIEAKRVAPTMAKSLDFINPGGSVQGTVSALLSQKYFYDYVRDHYGREPS